jgi:transketolase
VILIATGSEVHITLQAARELTKEGIAVRVVALPCWEIFDRQCPEYRALILPPEVKARVAVEAGLKLGWEHYVGLDGAIIGMESFGASAPAGVLFKKFGITVASICDAARGLIKRK